MDDASPTPSDPAPDLALANGSPAARRVLRPPPPRRPSPRRPFPHRPPLRCTADARLPIDGREFRLRLYRDPGEGAEHLALVHGHVGGAAGVLTRVHSECFTGDVLGSLRCDCGEQLRRALHLIAAAEAGVLIYLRQEGRGIGLAHKLLAYGLQDRGYDTVDANLLLGHGADERDYAAAGVMLYDLGVRSVRLLTNNPGKLAALERLGVPVDERVALEPAVTPENERYLRTKVERMGHVFTLGRVVGGSGVGVPGREHPGSGWGSGSGLEVSRRPTDPDPDPSAAGADPDPGSFAVGLDADPNGDATRAAAAVDRLRARFPCGGDAHRRPFVTLTYAQSLDGSIAIRRGWPLALSGRESLVLTHRLRAAHDAILIGVGTLLSDDPRLTVRLVDGRDPRPVVLDSRLRTPPNARLLSKPTRRPLIATTAAADRERQAALEAAGARVVRLAADPRGLVSLDALLELLAAERVSSIMVEGGARVITSFLRARSVDHVLLTVAATLVGGLRAVGPLAASARRDGDARPLRLRGLETFRLGDDVVLAGAPLWEAA